MKKATKSWHERTFDQYISKEKLPSGKKKHVTKLIKAWTGPKKNPPLLSDVTWLPAPGFPAFWTTPDDVTKIGLEECTFYSIPDNEVYFCSMRTFNLWLETQNISYRGSFNEWRVSHDKRKEFLLLYQLINLEYYEPFVGET